MGLTTEDRLGIMETLSRYNQAIDGFLPNAAEAWADTFTEDGTFRAVGDVQPDASHAGILGSAYRASVLEASHAAETRISARGRAELCAFAASVHEAPRRLGYHWVNNVIIEGDGDRASMTCYLRTMQGKTTDSPEEVGVTGYYRDQLRKVGGAWKFESRFVMFDS